jgi:uncharacterized phage-associated protein
MEGQMSVQFGFDFERTLAALVYVASKPEATGYKLCKLVFLSDKLHIVRFGRPITGDQLRAMDYGPVPSNVYDLLKGVLAKGEDHEQEHVRTLAGHLSVDRRYANPRFQVARQVDYGYFLSPVELNALDEVVAAHGRKSFDELYTLTHEMPAYKKAWEDPARSSRNPLMSFEDLFTNDSEAIAGAQEEMVEDYEMRQTLQATDAAF